MSTWVNSVSATAQAVDSYGANPSAIAFGAGKFIIPSSTGGTPAIASSDGGVTWAPVPGLPAPFQFIAFGAGVFVCGATPEFPNNEILDYATSADGVTWTARTINLNTVFGIIFNHVFSVIGIKFVNGAFHVFFKSDNVGTSVQMCSSVDGINWTNSSASFLFSSSDIIDIAFGAGKYNIVVGASVYTGATLATLTQQALFVGFPNRNAIAFGAGLFIAIDDSDDLLYTSPDGAVWTPISVPPDPPGGPNVSIPIGIQFVSGKFYCGVINGTDRFFSSPDGATWTEEIAPSPPGPGFSALCFATDGATVVGLDPFNSPLSVIHATGGVVVPDVVTELLATAEADIATATLITGSIGFAPDPVIPAGHVKSQSPIGGTVVAAGSPVDLIVSTGATPPLIFRLIQKLLLRLHRVFDKDPYQQLALRLQYDGGMTWTISNGILETTVTGGSGSDLSIQLYNFTIANLATFLATLPGYSVPYQDTSSYAQVSALALIDSGNDIDTSNGDHIYGYTNLLWAYLDAIGSELGTAKAQISNMLAQMVVPTSEDEWLDEHGSYYLVPRNSGESDAIYSPRIIAQVLQPRGNNVAIASAIQSLAPLAQRVRVIDAINDLVFSILYNGLIHFDGSAFYDAGLGPNSGYGFFDIDFSFDFTGPVTQDEYFALIRTTVESFRDGGTQLRGVIFRNNESSTLIVSDTFVGGVRVIVYDDFSTSSYRLLESGLVRLLESGDARILE